VDGWQAVATWIDRSPIPWLAGVTTCDYHAGCPSPVGMHFAVVDRAACTWSIGGAPQRIVTGVMPGRADSTASRFVASCNGGVTPLPKFDRRSL